MRVIEAGHQYELDSLRGSESQTLIFPKVSPKESGSKEIEMDHDGTTNEEVLRVLIDRQQFQLNKLHSEDGQLALSQLKGALECLERRTNERKARGVEGTMTA